MLSENNKNAAVALLWVAKKSHRTSLEYSRQLKRNCTAVKLGLRL